MDATWKYLTGYDPDFGVTTYFFRSADGTKQVPSSVWTAAGEAAEGMEAYLTAWLDKQKAEA